MNAAAALVVSGVALDLGDGMARAAASIDSGAARRALDALVAISQEAA
jgi:anthranilate phosphoribosyltransferase